MFFSTLYCESVKDFQCVHKTDEASVTEASTSNAVRNGLIALSVVMFVVVVVLVAVLLWLWYRSRQNRKVAPMKEASSNPGDRWARPKDKTPIISN